MFLLLPTNFFFSMLVETQLFLYAKLKNKPVFSYNVENIKVVDDFDYFGITFNHNCSFLTTKLNLVEQSRKDMFSAKENKETRSSC